MSDIDEKQVEKEKKKLARERRALEKQQEELERQQESLVHIKKIEALLRHIRNVQDSCEILGKRLIEIGEFKLGRNLIANSLKHDISKFYGIEWENLNTESADGNKDLFLSALNQHQQTNDHHPEFWDGVEGMPTVCVAEMVCDWHARSKEMGTDLRAFFTENALTKYSIPKNGKKYKEIKRYIDLMLDPTFKPVKP